MTTVGYDSGSALVAHNQPICVFAPSSFSPQNLDAIAGCVSLIAGNPAELNAGAVNAILTTLSAIAGGGAFVSGAAANSTAAALSSVVASLVAASPLPPEQRRRLFSSEQPGGVLGAVSTIIDSLSSSLQSSFDVPGENPAVITSPKVHLVSQLDSPGPGSRLFSAPLSGPGSTVNPLPKNLFAASGQSGAGGGGVQTAFAALKFK